MAASGKRQLELSELSGLCLHHLAEEPAQLAEFMGFAGYDPASLKRAIGTDQLAQGLIDYFGSNEPLLLSLCANHGFRPEEFMRVWHRLNPAH